MQWSIPRLTPGRLIWSFIHSFIHEAPLPCWKFACCAPSQLHPLGETFGFIKLIDETKQVMDISKRNASEHRKGFDSIKQSRSLSTSVMSIRMTAGQKVDPVHCCAKIQRLFHTHRPQGGYSGYGPFAFSLPSVTKPGFC